MFISTTSENMVYICALQFPFWETMQKNSCVSFHVFFFLLLNICIFDFSSLLGFFLLAFGFLLEACVSVL